MFKSTKSTYPATPKIPSLALPAETGVEPSSWFRSPFKSQSKSKPVSHYPEPQRPMTPSTERVRKDSFSTAYSSRTRTSSMSSSSSQTAPKSILKPPKQEVSPSVYVPPPPKNMAHLVNKSATGQYKPTAMSDRRVHSHMGDVPRSKHLHGAHLHADGYMSDSIVKPTSGYKTKTLDEGYHSGRRYSHSSIRQEPSEGKYDYVVVTESPLKDESISLNWPLVDVAERKKRNPALLYFDAAFDPRFDRNLAVWGQGAFVRVKDDVSYLPVSSHCAVTKMVIVCKKLSRWPIVVERNQGLRCMDVFIAIYETFSKPLTHREKEEMGSFIRTCEPVFHRRCEDAPGLAVVNQRKGMLRIDLLRGCRIFKGIKQSGSEWTLTFDEPAPSSRSRSRH